VKSYEPEPVNSLILHFAFFFLFTASLFSLAQRLEARAIDYLKTQVEVLLEEQQKYNKRILLNNHQRIRISIDLALLAMRTGIAALQRGVRDRDLLAPRIFLGSVAAVTGGLLRRCFRRRRTGPQKGAAALFCLKFVFLRRQMTAGSGPMSAMKPFGRRFQQFK